jgi:recombination DNA repair RAD52 pathway protein
VCLTANTNVIDAHHFSTSMRPPQQDICSDDVLPENPSDDGPIPTARKVTPNTDGVEREYLDVGEVVNLINQSLGSDRWSSEIRNMKVDFVRPHIAGRLPGTDVQQADTNPNTGRTSVGVSTIIRITLANGTFHEVCL